MPLKQQRPGLEARNLQADKAAQAVFLRRQHGDACSMAGPCGEPSGCRFPV